MVKRFTEHHLPFTQLGDILPEKEDPSTLFVCSGMQRWKDKFRQQTLECFSTLQTCLRMKDMEEVGDGTHLTSFKMLGNFSFGNGDYEQSVELWDGILSDLDIKVGSLIHVHPSQHWHKELWLKRGYHLRYDPDCTWSDGDIQGYCCEVYIGDLEIGNLVNPMGHSVDVGFGWERLIQVLSQCRRVDETELFDTSLHPVLRDHFRTLKILHEQGIEPGYYGRGSVCRKLLRRSLNISSDKDIWPMELQDWRVSQMEKLERIIRKVTQQYPKHKDKSPEWWWSTYGVSSEDLTEITTGLP